MKLLRWLMLMPLLAWGQTYYNKTTMPPDILWDETFGTVCTATTLSTCSLRLRTALNGTTSFTRQIQFQGGASGTTNRWGLIANNIAETGLNAGSPLLVFAYKDDGSSAGTLWNGLRVSGPYGDGGPQFQLLAPWTQTINRATIPGGIYGNYQNIGSAGASDTQPSETLTDPITTTNGSGTVTITWANCCGITGPAYIGAFDSWVKITGATAVAGLTLNGWFQVIGNPTTSTLTVTCTVALCGATTASSNANGGGTVTITPSFTSVANKNFITTSSGAVGFNEYQTNYFIANPLFLPNTGQGVSSFQQYFDQFATPSDTGANYSCLMTCQWAATLRESDLIYRGVDAGYYSNPYTQANNSVGYWSGAYADIPSYIGGGGISANWGSVYACFQQHGKVANYNCFNSTPDALVGAQNDTTAHGGVGINIYGSYDAVVASGFATTIGTKTITVTLGGGANTPLGSSWAALTNGATVYIPNTYTLSNVTFGGTSYTIANVSAANGTFTITGGGSNAAASISGGGTGQYVAFQKLIPYGPAQWQGYFNHGVDTTGANFIDGYAERFAAGQGIAFTDGSGTASITSTATSAGNINISLNPVGSGVIKNGGTYGVPTVLLQWGVPICIPSSGTIGNNGALSAITTLGKTYPSIYMFFPASAIFAGSSAGFYYVVMSSATAGTIFNNTYTNGIPTIPASPTAFSTTGPGAYTQSTGTQTLVTMTVPGNQMGPNGTLTFQMRARRQSGTDTNNMTVNLAGVAIAQLQQASVQWYGLHRILQNNGATNVNTIFANATLTNGTDEVTVNGGADLDAIDTTANMTMTVTSSVPTAATDWIILFGGTVISSYAP